jgi:hypothetical protein
MKKEIVFGIDVGKSGAIAVALNGQIRIVKMPKDTKALRGFFESYVPEQSIVFMEKVSAFIGENDAKKYAIIKMLGQARELKTVLEFIGYEVIEVAPITWQTQLGLRFKGMEKAERKQKYFEFAKKWASRNKIHKYQGDAVCILACGLKMIKENHPLISGDVSSLDLF